jgi:hypothetical protein
MKFVYCRQSDISCFDAVDSVMYHQKVYVTVLILLGTTFLSNSVASII